MLIQQKIGGCFSISLSPNIAWAGDELDVKKISISRTSAGYD
jgi:hypothetical protein